MMAKAEKGKHYVKNYELATYSSLSNYPQSILKAMHVKLLIGQGGEIPEKDIRVWAFELNPGTDYGGHSHPRPETYIFTGGTAECQWGDEKFTVEPGTVTHCPPNMSHAMRVTSSEPLRAIIVAWAPGGRQEVWDVPSKMLRESGNRPV